MQTKFTISSEIELFKISQFSKINKKLNVEHAFFVILQYRKEETSQIILNENGSNFPLYDQNKCYVVQNCK